MKLEEKIKRFKEGGLDKMHVVADFDKTLTRAFVDGKAVQSIISILRDGDYISREYAEKSKALFAKYYPIERDPHIPIEEKKKALYTWWSEHFDLLIKSGLNKKHLQHIVQNKNLQFRKGALEFLDMLHEREIPLVIISSSGVGDAISLLLEREGRMHDNIHIVTNRFNWDKKGNAVAIQQPIIYGMNKNEVELSPQVHARIKERKNILLIGDSLDDLGMVAETKDNCLLSFGFLNPGEEMHKKEFEKVFDILIENDGNFDEINKFVKEIEG